MFFFRVIPSVFNIMASQWCLVCSCLIFKVFLKYLGHRKNKEAYIDVFILVENYQVQFQNFGKLTILTTTLRMAKYQMILWSILGLPNERSNEIIVVWPSFHKLNEPSVYHFPRFRAFTFIIGWWTSWRSLCIWGKFDFGLTVWKETEMAE